MSLRRAVSCLLLATICLLSPAVVHAVGTTRPIDSTDPPTMGSGDPDIPDDSPQQMPNLVIWPDWFSTVWRFIHMPETTHTPRVVSKVGKAATRIEWPRR